MTPEQEQRCRELREQGMSYAAISREIGKNPGNVYYLFNKEKNKAYNARPEVRERVKAYTSRPEVRERIRGNSRSARSKPENKAKKALYDSLPENKAKKAVRRAQPATRARTSLYNVAYSNDPQNKEKRDAYNSMPENKARKKAYQKYYRSLPENKEKIKAYHSSKEVRERMNERGRVRLKTDIQYLLRSRLRSRLSGALKGNFKAGSAVRDLGCSIPELKVYLENQFIEGMSWDNHGEWHIDHILPMSSFDLTDRDQLLECCNYKNLQPLWAHDNLSKGNKVLV